MRGAWMLVFGLVGVSPLAAQEPKAASPLPGHVVAAWEKAGTDAVWFVPDEFGKFAVRHRAAGVNGEVPGFAFATLPPAQGVLGRLPAPDRPFGLSLDGRKWYLTDAILKELAGLKNLQTLALSSIRGVTDAGVKELATLTSLRTLDLNNTAVTDAGLKELSGLTSLQTLYLGATNVTGPGLKALTELKSLHSLDLSETQLSDAGLERLTELKTLRHLNLARTSITDSGLKQLAQMKSLQTLDLTGTGPKGALKASEDLDLRFLVTDTGVAELQKSLPGVRILR